MSQRLTEDVVRALKKGDTLYSNVIEFTREDGTTHPATATVLGSAKFDNPIERWVLPVRREYGAFADGHIGGLGGSELWRTVPEKIVPTHVHRVRRPAPSVHSEPEQEEPQPTHRVRRSRPVVEEVEVTPTGRIRCSRDVHSDLLDNAQEQLNTLRRRRTRSA